MAENVKAARSPLPWKVGYSDGSGGLEDEAVVRYQHGLCITDADNEPVVIGGDHDGCSVGVLDPDDAKLIVACVNNMVAGGAEGLREQGWTLNEQGSWEPPKSKG